MMKEKIQTEKWGESLNRFSEINQNRPTRLEVMGQVGNLERDYWIEDGLFLMGIDVDLKGCEAPRVQIMLSSKSNDLSHFTHVISNVKNVVVELDYNGQFEGLHIEDKEGARVVLRFEESEVAAVAT